MNRLRRTSLSSLLCVAALFPLQAQETEAALFERASQALQQNRYLDAEHGFAQVLKLDPRSVPALGNLGVLYAHTHRFALAIETYRNALKIDPSNEPLTLNLGLAYLKQEDNARARPYFQKLVTLHPEDGKFRTLLATSMILGDAPRAGLDVLLPSALSKDSGPAQASNDPSILYLVAVGYARTGQMSAGREVFNRLLQSAATRPQANLLLAQAFYDGQKFPEAKQTLDEVLAENPAYPGAHRQLGKVYISMHRNADAERELRSAIADDPKDADALYFLGALLVQIGIYPEGISLLQHAALSLPDSWAIPFYLGKAHLKLHQTELAVSDLQAAVALNADEPSVFYLLANALRVTGHPTEAKQAMLRVEQLHSTALEAEKAAMLGRIAGSR